MVFLAYGGLIARNIVGSQDPKMRKLGAITSGIGLVFILVGGFGLLHRLGYGFELWVIVKIVIWVILGAMIVVINRKPNLSKVFWWGTLVLGFIALLMVVLKPSA